MRIISVLSFHRNKAERADLVQLPDLLVPTELVGGLDAVQAHQAVALLELQHLVFAAAAGCDVRMQLFLGHGLVNWDSFAVDLQLFNVLLLVGADTNESDVASVADGGCGVVLTLFLVALGLEDGRGDSLAEDKLDEGETAAVALPAHLLDNKVVQVEVRVIHGQLDKVIFSWPVETVLFVQIKPIRVEFLGLWPEGFSFLGQVVRSVQLGDKLRFNQASGLFAHVLLACIVVLNVGHMFLKEGHLEVAGEVDFELGEGALEPGVVVDAVNR